MFLTIVCIILCIVFTIAILIPQYKNPLSQIVSYPPAIRKRVESLPQYQDVIKTTKRKNVVRKMVAAVIFIPIILVVISYFSGAETFLSTFLTSFIVFTVVNLYDLIVLDIV